MLLRGAGVLLFGGLLPLGLALASLSLARSLPVEQFGRVGYFFSLYGTFVALGALGLTSYVSGSVASSLGAGDRGKLQVALGTGALLRGLTLAPLAGGWLVGRHFGQSELAAALGCSAISLALQFIVGALQGFGAPVRATALLSLVGCLYLGAVLLVRPAEAELVFILFATAHGPALAGALVLLAARLRADGLVARISRQVIPGVLIAAGEFWALGLLLVLSGNVGPLLLGWQGRFTDLASLTIALSLAGLPALAFQPVVSSLFWPRFRLLLAAGDEAGSSGLFGLCWRVAAAGSIVSLAVLALAPTEIVGLLYTERHLVAATLLPFLLPWTLGLAPSSLLTWTLQAKCGTRLALGLVAAQLTLLAGVALPLQTMWGAPGLAAAHSLALSAALAVGVMMLSRQTRYRLWLARVWVACVAVMVGGAMMSFIHTASPFLRVALFGLTAAGISAWVLFWRELRLWWKSRGGVAAIS
jgi:O-antigen/teichoic acid export membrane protein